LKRQTHINTNHTKPQTPNDAYKHSQIQVQPYRNRNIHTLNHTYTHTHKHTYMQTNIHTYRVHTNVQSYNNTEIQAYIHA